MQGGITWFLVWGGGGLDCKSTVAGRKPVKRLGEWAGEFHWEDLVTSTTLRQVLKQLQVSDGSSMQQTEQLVDVSKVNPYTYQGKRCVYARTVTHLVTVDRAKAARLVRK